MKKLSLNIKKIALSLLVVGLAVGFSAFTSAKKTDQIKLAPFYYGYVLNDNVYRLISETTEPTGDCISSGTNQCVVISATNLGPEISQGTGAGLPAWSESSANAYYFLD